ncbi:MAG: hypothetical protein NXI32_21940 [bacterium]|nr:hypothetical protein [bacterium]
MSLYILDIAQGEVKLSVSTLGRRCRGVAFSPDNRGLVTASESELALWDCKDGQQLAAHVAREGRNFITVFEDWIATGNEGSVELRDSQTLELVKTFEMTPDQNDRFGFSNVGDVSFAKNERRMVSGSWNNTLTLWDLDSTQPLLTIRAHNAGIHHVAFTPDEESIISSGHDGLVRIWRTRNRSMH